MADMQVRVGQRVEICEGSWLSSRGRVVATPADKDKPREGYVWVELDQSVRHRVFFEDHYAEVYTSLVEVKACTLAEEVT